MVSAYQKTIPGMRIGRTSAKQHNTLIDVAREWEANHNSQISSDSGTDTHVEILNASGDLLDEYSVVGLSEVIISPAEHEHEFQQTRGFHSTSPTNTGPFAILQTALLDQDIGPARVSGETWVQVDFSDASHEYAAPYHNTYTNLRSQAEAGPARILWKESGDGLLWALVGLGMAGGGGESAFHTIATPGGTAFGPQYTFQISTEGGDFDISAEDTFVTFHLPDASLVARGVVSQAVQDFNGSKHFYNDPGATHGIRDTGVYSGQIVIVGAAPSGLINGVYCDDYVNSTLKNRTFIGPTYITLWHVDAGSAGGLTIQHQNSGATDYLMLTTILGTGGYAVQIGTGGTKRYGVNTTDLAGNTIAGGIIYGIGTGFPGNSAHWAGDPANLLVAINRIAAWIFTNSGAVPIP